MVKERLRGIADHGIEGVDDLAVLIDLFGDTPAPYRAMDAAALELDAMRSMEDEDSVVGSSINSSCNNTNNINMNNVMS